MTDRLQLTEFAGFTPNYQFRASLCREYHRLITSSADAETLLLEARPGIGATSLCAEYFKSIDELAILLTVHGRSRIGYSIPYLIEQALRQANALLGEESRSIHSGNIVSEWQRTLPKLTRKARSLRQKLYVVIDGLYQIPTDDEKYQNEVVKEVLFFGNSDIKYLITWGEGQERPAYLRTPRTRIVTIPPLYDSEAIEFLKAEGVPDQWHQQIVQSLGGVPAKLASIARLHSLGKLDQLNVKSSIEEFYEEEFKALLEKGLGNQSDLELALSFVTFSKRPLSREEVHRLSGVSETCMALIEDAEGFVQKEVSTGLITVTSNTHREFLARRLASRKANVIRRFVDQLTEEPSSADSIQLLPTYYSELGEYAQTASLLTVENLDAFLQATHSIAALKQRNALGFAAASKAKQEVEAFRFAMQGSIIRAYEDGPDNEPLLAALAATGRLDEALQVAEGEATNEGKLVLLARYASLLDSKGLKADHSILNQLETLVKGLDLAADRDRAVSIAEYLIGPFPELAFQIIEESANGNPAIKDAAYSHFAITQASSAKGKPRIDRFKEYVSKISDSKTLDFLRAAESVLATKSSGDLLDSTSGMDGRRRAFFLRQWLGAHFREEAAIQVAKVALDEAASDATYAPSASDLRVICIPLIFSSDKAEAAELLQRIEIQRTSLIDLSPTVDRIRLDLAVARAKVALGQVQADATVEEIYLHISYIPDDGIRLECLCWLQSQLRRFETLSAQVADALRRLTESGIQQAIEACLRTTAEHIDVFRGAVSALVEFNPRIAFDIVSKINTAERRDTAHLVLIHQLITRASAEAIPVEYLTEAIFKITDEGKRWVAVVKCLDMLAKHSPELSEKPTRLTALADQVGDPLGKAYAKINALKVLHAYGIATDVSDAGRTFRDWLESVDEAFKVPELYFEFVEALAQIDKTQASKMLDDYWNSDLQLRAQSESQFAITAALCRLAMVSFAGTLKHHQDTDDALQTMIEAIERLASIRTQCSIMADLVVRAHAVHRPDIVNLVCENHLSPLIKGYSSSNAFVLRRLVESAYPALFIWNSSVANDLVSRLPIVASDQARSVTIDYLITRTPLSEPYDDSSLKNARVSWTDGLTIVTLIEQMKTDNLLVSALTNFSLAASSKASQSLITSAQRVELARRLKKKCDSDLPDPENIQHAGWRIVAHGACAKLAGDVSQSTWNDLIEAAKTIPNTSDSVYVLGVLSTQLPPKMSAERLVVVKEAESRLALIPSRVDSVRRAVSLSQASATVDSENELAKRILRSAMRQAMALRDQAAAIEAQRNVIDQAYRIDEDFAEELIKEIDDDPARTRALSAARIQLAQQKAKGALIKKRYEEVADFADYSGLGWETLASLNAGNVPGQKQDELGAMLSRVAQCSMEDAYGFYWLYLRFLQRKYEHSVVQSKQILVPVAEVNQVALLLAERIGNRIWGASRRSENFYANRVDGDAGFVRVPGSGKVALDFIKNWLQDRSAANVLICDPYFRPENIDFVKELLFLREDLEFVILSCNNELDAHDLEAAYLTAWTSVAHVEPPSIRIVHINYEGGRSSMAHVIHDRWIFVGEEGLRLGTSVGALTGTKVFELSGVGGEESRQVLAVLLPFVDMRPKTLDGKRLKYSVVQW